MNCWRASERERVRFLNIASHPSDLSIHMLSVAVQPEVGELPPQTVVLQYIQHPGHLAEDQDTRPLLQESWQELVQHTHLATVDHQMSVSGEWWP